MKATIYIPDDQANVYEEAKEKLGESISKTFVRCLQRELENVKLKTDRIVVDLYDKETGRYAKKAFEGRFIVGSSNEGEDFFWLEESGIRGGGAYSVAVTKANRLAVLYFDHDKNVTDLDTFEDFDRFQSAGDSAGDKYPPSLVQAVGAEVGVEVIEDLDI